MIGVRKPCVKIVLLVCPAHFLNKRSLPNDAMPFALDKKAGIIGIKSSM